jgi:hypothetical protein
MSRRAAWLLLFNLLCRHGTTLPPVTQELRKVHECALEECDIAHSDQTETSPISRSASRINNALALEVKRQGPAEIVDISVLM